LLRFAPKSTIGWRAPRSCRLSRCLLWVIRDWVEPATKRDHVRYAPKADKSPHRSEMTRWARRRHRTSW
jgi:hypothetical protein